MSNFKNYNSDTNLNGNYAEQKFILECLAKKINNILKPININSPYDFIIDINNNLLRIQIKSTWSERKTGNKNFSTKEKYKIGLSSDKHKKYPVNSFDFLIAYIGDFDIWYIIPSHLIINMNSFNVYPTDNYVKSTRDAGKFEIFKNNWDILFDDNKLNIALNSYNNLVFNRAQKEIPNRNELLNNMIIYKSRLQLSNYYNASVTTIARWLKDLNLSYFNDEYKSLLKNELANL